MAATASSTNVTIDVTKDLGSLSDLKNLFTGQGTAIFGIGSELSKYAGQPIHSAVKSTPVKLTVQGDPKWKTKSGISFSLTPAASCTIAVSDTSTKFSVVKSVDTTECINICAGPSAGVVYINIDLDCDIKGNVSGSGKIGGLGISGKASGSSSATLSYCHPVNANTETVAALKQAFAALFFPFEPDCALNMPVGSIGKVNFDGTLNCELDVTYGLGSYKLSAQNLGLTKQGVKVAWDKLTPPSVNINAGAKASVGYTHSDNFSVLVQKIDAATAHLYLLRSAKNETTESVGITVGISPTACSATVDAAKLTDTIKHTTGSGSPTLASDVASYAQDIQTNLVTKANKWLSSKKGDAGLMLSLSQQNGRTILFAFNVNLSAATATLVKESWEQLVSGDLRKALQIGGFTLLPGSGVAETLKHSCALQLHFFNFHLASETDYFRNSTTKLGPDGCIEFYFDVGQEAQFTVNNATTTASIHFVATATEDTQGADNYRKAEVDLYIELSEKNNPNEATRIASAIGALGVNATVQAAQQRMLAFVAANQSKTLSLINIFKPAAYQKLSCSPYTTDANHKVHPPALPQQQDQNNWDAFQAMVESLMADMAPIASPMKYATWMDWNVKSNDSITAQVDATHLPNRRQVGDYTGASQYLFGADWQPPNKFLLASTRFLQLCDNLQSLAAVVAKIETPEDWNNVVDMLTKWVKSGVDPDWSKPALGALLYLCSLGKYQVDADFQQPKDNSKLTCTVTLS